MNRRQFLTGLAAIPAALALPAWCAPIAQREVVPVYTGIDLAPANSYHADRSAITWYYDDRNGNRHVLATFVGLQPDTTYEFSQDLRRCWPRVATTAGYDKS